MKFLLYLGLLLLLPTLTRGEDFSTYQDPVSFWTYLDSESAKIQKLVSADPTIVPLVHHIQAGCRDLVKRFPTDAHAWSAKLLEARMDSFAEHQKFASALPFETVNQHLQDLVNAKEAPQDVRGQAYIYLIGRLMRHAVETDDESDATWEDIDKKIYDLRTQFGDNVGLPGQNQLVLAFYQHELDVISKWKIHTHYRLLTSRLLSDPNPMFKHLGENQHGDAIKLPR